MGNSINRKKVKTNGIVKLEKDTDGIEIIHEFLDLPTFLLF
jgi:hypothetical protein